MSGSRCLACSLYRNSQFPLGRITKICGLNDCFYRCRNISGFSNRLVRKIRLCLQKIKFKEDNFLFHEHKCQKQCLVVKNFTAFQSYFSNYVMPVFEDSWNKFNTPQTPKKARR